MSNFINELLQVDTGLARELFWSVFIHLAVLIATLTLFELAFRKVKHTLNVRSWQVSEGYRKSTFGRWTKKYYDEGGR